MPQLEISSWPTVILSMVVALFYFIQMKMLNFTFHTSPLSNNIKNYKYNTTWQMKWTKIYLPLSTSPLS
uniref:ATP synthase F0 subunit 8 n=1 Tax=Cacajao calvus rubicundus TaxID=658400 RepID=UPI0020370A02|nr:ATP synthase F0 subunit 8 [Cacajao calvus rubicundus]YP_010409535.1 ATP synthase F0 subunit 8 [Cacajao calvus novaesi]YP_010409613.1 ATP synthase F0 subunit 8 [Cacajao calvus ucayalii]URH14173.1 ATP synthase F0 subunit 8 [Cacajao calvus]URH13861.1 ATP synthase F0 subunit 8 [Cacajao calvus rubicundus]URH13887.1 ATP synthase F0 subunit 8 [Cacajao calvus novaesi]URH13991.1 ATP synthase F0 subunit 8 [Cacajao calvus ucayalii]URH14017.1 ATP synthase F0 subunit 8 [Cacajao calvus rubicundus]